ncbi:PAS domain S-box protein [uncultured Brevundimonas sp.]|uniref:PAS domain S-box protein n=1 Tax=uncultured Brevundimonas sp. TaxID=213418 RepID=UPI0030EDD9B4
MEDASGKTADQFAVTDIRAEAGYGGLKASGRLADLIRSSDWSRSPLGPPERWPSSLHTVVELMLASQFPMFIAWGEDLGFLYNDAYVPILGEKHPAALGRPFEEIWSEIWADILPMVEAAMDGKATYFEDLPLLMNRKGHDEQTWFTFSYSPVRDESGEVAGMFCACTETTNRVLADRRVASEQARQRAMLQQMPGFTAVLSGPEHTFDYVNDAYVEISGPRDFIGRSVRDAFPELEGQGFFELLDQVYASGERYVARGMPVRLERQDGDRLIDLLYEPIRDEKGLISGIFVGGYDVTDVSRVTQALQESQARQQQALEAANLGAFVWFPDRDLAEADERMMAMFGLPSDGHLTLQTALAQSIHPEDGPAYAEAVGRALDPAGNHRLNHDIRILQPDGTLRWLTITGQVQFDGDTPVRMAGIAQDITALRDSESRYRTLFQTIDEGFCLIEFIDGPHGPLSDYMHVEANPAAGEQVGLAEVEGRTIRELAGEEAQPWIDLYGEVLRTGNSVRFEKEYQPTGRFLELAAFRIEPASRRQVAVLFKDLTERRKAERALRESEAQFRAFAQAVPNHVWASRPDGHLYWFNEQVYLYTGTTEGTLDGTDGWGAIVHPDDLAGAAESWGRSLGSGQSYRTEFRIRRTDGEWRRFAVHAEPVRDDTGDITRWVGANIDIEDIRLQGEELERVNDILSDLLTGATAERDQLWTLSTDMLARADYDGGLSAVNPAWTETLGWTEQELLTNPYADIINPEDVEATVAALTTMQETGRPTRFQNRVLSKTGAWTPIDWTVAPEPDGENFIAVGRDLTEDKAREQQLMQAQEALRQSQKMEAVGQLTGGIAHDFNNLLAGISGSLELLEKRIGEGRLNGVDRYITAAQGAAQRAAALTQRLLAFSRRQTLDPKAIDVNRLIAGMEDLIRRSVGPTVEVEVVGAGGLWATRMDPSQLENALLNLCINSRDAMAPEGGRLTIETANKWLDDRAARERDLPPGQYVSLCVTDTGSGMTPEVISQAFDPFFTTKPLGQGTGLGLSMIHGFVRQSGGQVRIYSEIGKGTTMCLYMPRFMGAADDVDISHGSLSGVEGHGETVLIIDDEPTVRMLIVEVLEDAGYRALQADDGPSGLALLRSDIHIDLLITDVGLPGGMNGRQVADAARETRPDLKVLFVTGYAENAAVGNGLLDAGMEVLTKPFIMAELGEKIRDMIERP